MPPYFDHLIFLVPYASLANPPLWIAKNFTLTPGGRHADGKTENKLICFRDGSYIELIAFINDDPKHREGHWWGEKKFGIVDFAFTNSTGDALTHFSQLEKRLSQLRGGPDAVRVEYQPPVAGARRRPDGEEVKWEVTFPVVTTGYQRGELPFFCHDLTPRSLRAPFSEESVKHPNGSYGINVFNIYVPVERVNTLAEAYSAILGVENMSKGEYQGLFGVERLHKLDGGGNVTLCLRAPGEEWQVAAMKKRGGVLLGDLILGGTDSPWGNEGME
jgi:hypothetical protein